MTEQSQSSPNQPTHVASLRPLDLNSRSYLFKVEVLLLALSAFAVNVTVFTASVAAFGSGGAWANWSGLLLIFADITDVIM